MQSYQQATQAYAASSARRSVREQEAEVFRRTNAALRRGRDSGGLARTRALIDTQRLWGLIIDMVNDPDNALPPDLRASLISVGMTVRRELQSESPDIDFLLTVNENIAAGLSGTP